MEGKGLYFVIGAALGAAGAWLFSKKYYEKIANEEIESMKEVFRTHNLTPVKDEKKAEMAKENREKPNIMEYGKILQREGYVDYSHTGEEKVETKRKMNKFGKDVPYVISPEEYGENEDYERITYTYYSDGVVTHGEDYEIVRDVGDMLGEDFADHFGDYEDDSVHIRNDVLGIDYEVLYDDRTFEEVVGPRSGEWQ